MRYKNIIKPLAFTLGLFILLVLLSDFLNHHGYYVGSYSKMNDILHAPKNSVDYLLIGDSECSTSISPIEVWNEYGYTGYNCGIPGQRLQETYYWLKKVLKNQSPNVVLLETNEFYRKFNYVNQLESAVDYGMKYKLPVFQYHNDWAHFNINSLKPNTLNQSLLPHTKVIDGFKYNIKIKPYKKGPYIHKTKKLKYMSDEAVSYLNRIVALCKERHIQLILYSVPTPLCWSYAKHNTASLYAKENHLPYIDLNFHLRDLKINWSKDTRDRGNHLNYYGAQKITAYMGNYLANHSKLIDHRGDKRYDQWNDDYQNYLMIMHR
jgi:hypothetical protein